MKKINKIERSLGRSENYYNLSSEEQWAEDKKLGVLDWDGTKENAKNIFNIKRQVVTNAIASLWLAMRALSDHPELMTEDDLDVWDAVTKHHAIQDKLDKCCYKQGK